MRRTRLAFFVGVFSLAVAVTIGLWTLVGPGQEGSIGSRPGLLWVGALSILGACSLVAHNLLFAAPPIPRSVIATTNPADTGQRRSAPARSHSERAEDIIGHAGVPFGLPEYVAACLVAGAFALVVGTLLIGLAAGLILAAVVAAAAVVWPRMAASRRTTQFNEQLPDALMVIASGMRAGQSLPRALDMLARSSEAPMSDELTRALAESRVGRPLVDALADVAVRTRSDTFSWVAEAITTNRQLGGNLASVLETSAETIRSREKVNKKVRAVSAEGRASAGVLIALPIVLSLIVLQLNPGYMSPLWDDTIGRIMLALALFMLVSGGLWIQRLIRVDF